MTIIGSTNNANWTFKLEAYERGETIDINNNTSVVRVDVFIGRASSRSYCGGAFSGSVTVDGQVQGFSGTIPYPTYVDGGAWLYTGITKDFTVGHNADGSKTVGVSSSWSADFTPSSASANGSLGLTTIARKTGLSNQTGTINNQMTISFSPASSSFRHTLTYSFGSASGTLATKTSANSINWTPPTSLYQYISNAKSGVGSLTLTTFSGDTNIGSNTARLTLNQDLSDVKPTISTVSITDTNTITSTLTGNPNVIVANASTLSASVTGKTKYYSTGKSITVGGQPMTITSTQDGVDYDVSGTLTITEPNITSLDVILTDMRDNASDTYTPSENIIINYFKPTLSFDAFRPSPTTGEIEVEYSGNFWAGNFATNTPNQLTLTWEYKTSDSSTWTTGGTLSGYTIDSTTNTYTGSESLGSIFDYRNNYNIRIKYGDSVNANNLYTTFSITVPRGIPIFYWTKDKFCFEQTEIKSKSDILTELVSPYDYTLADTEKIKAYILGTGTLTDEELRKYDVDNDGDVDTRDYVIIKNFIDFGIDTTHSAKLRLKCGETPYELAYIWEDASGNEIINIGKNGVSYEGVPISNNEMYETGEKVVGQWIDGKPIYRKVFEINFSNRNEITQNVSFLNYDKIIKIYGISNTNPIGQDYFVNSTDFLRTYIDSTQTLHVRIGSNYPTIPLTVYVIIEYTKTTD